MKKHKSEIVNYTDLSNKTFDRIYFYSDPSWSNTKEFHLRNKQEHFYFTGPGALDGTTSIESLKINNKAAFKLEIEELLKNQEILEVKRIESKFNSKTEFNHEKFQLIVKNNVIEIEFKIWSSESARISLYSHHPCQQWQLIHDGVGFHQ